jgi:hypothetical protein
MATLTFTSTTATPSYAWSFAAGTISEIPSFQRMRTHLRDLVHQRSSWDTLQLNPLDCESDAGDNNCAQVCANATLLFRPANLRICAMLAAASLLVQNQTMSYGLPERVAREWHVPNLARFDAAGVFDNVTYCISSSCNSEVGSCNDQIKQLSRRPVNAGNLEGVVATLGTYCNHVNSIVNTDMAGPGVILSYLFQTSIALVFFILSRIFTPWPGTIFRTLGFCRISLREKSQRLQNKIYSTRFAAAVLTSLVEFQEVQMYFVGSIQIATLISFNPSHPNAGGSNSKSYASALLSSATASALGVCGVYTILLCQICLQREGMRWWYLFILMTVVCGLAVAIIAGSSSLLPKREDLWEKFRTDEPLLHCGGNPSPMTFCGPPLNAVAAWSSGAEAKYVFAVFGSLAYIGLFIDQLSYALRDKTMRSLENPLSGLRNIPLATKAWPWLRDTYWLAMQTFLLTCCILYYALLVQVSPRAKIGDATEWTFGQLIAVMVWAPTIVKYIYFNIFGVEEGFKERIAKTTGKSQAEQSEGPSLGATTYQREPRHAATYPLLAVGKRGVVK